MIPRLTITRSRRRAEEGVHRPPVVRASDGHDYVLKLGNRDPDFPACELVAAVLAPSFGVEVPPFALIELTSGFRILAAVLGPEWADIAAMPAGALCFASRWLPGALPWTASLAGTLADPSAALRLFAFDVYIENGDRQPGNPNVLVEGRRLVAIDHGQALPCVQGLRDIGPFEHADHVAWPLIAADPSALHGVYELQPSDAEIDAAVGSVPAGWWTTSDRPDFARAALRARRGGARDILWSLGTT